MPTQQQKPGAIRSLVLIPFFITFLLTLGLVLFSTNAFFEKQQQLSNHDTTERVKLGFKEQINHDISDISGITGFIANNPQLKSAWLAKDRPLLSRVAQDLYTIVNQRFDITHFYIHTPDGKNFLRAHRPGRFGDIITRKTLLASRRSGQISAGLEVGTFGQFVLRIVQPWIINGKLVGYLELGREISHITNRLKQTSGVELISLIDKQLINYNDWLKVFGPRFDWGKLDKWVISSSTLAEIPPDLDLHPTLAEQPREYSHPAKNQGKYDTSSFPLYNFSNESVGYMIVVHYTAASARQLHSLQSKIVIASLILGSLLFVAYFIYLGRIEKRLANAHRALYQKIGEHKKSESALKKNRDELAAINRELESYSYSIAHDLRAPLRSVTSFSQIVMEDARDKLDKDDIDNLRRVVDASKRMAELIDDILQLSRITREELSLETVNLSKLANRIKQQLSDNHPERQVEWDIQPDMIVQVDPQLMERALENLINNAWKYTSHTDHAKISFGSMQQNGETVYFVRDNGAGFDMRYAHKLFATFQRLHNPREFEGSGVGLAIVLRVIQRHHGRIWGEGEPNKGASFYFTLPNSDPSA